MNGSVRHCHYQFVLVLLDSDELPVQGATGQQCPWAVMRHTVRMLASAARR
jgi:hypothetical protein